MLKRDMQKFFKNFYVFSKYTVSFILLICLIFSLYLLFQSYKKQQYLSKNSLDLENIIKEDVNENYKSIRQVFSEVELTKNSLSKIEDSIKSLKSQNKNEEINLLIKNIESLSNKLDLLSSEVQGIKNTRDDKFRNTDLKIDNNKKEILDLILIKYQNYLNVDNELNFLETIIDSSKKKHLEKIRILKIEPFLGFESLEKKFDEEINIFLKNKINTNSKNYFLSSILPYINVSPSSENRIDDRMIILLNKIKIEISNKNIYEAYKNLNYLDESKTYFNSSIEQIKNYLDFKKEIISLR